MAASVKQQTDLQELQDRVTELEKQLRGIKAQVAPRPKLPWWKRIVGKFEQDPIFDEVAKEMRRQRRAAYAALKGKVPQKSRRQHAGRSKKSQGA